MRPEAPPTSNYSARAPPRELTFGVSNPKSFATRLSAPRPDPAPVDRFHRSPATRRTGRFRPRGAVSERGRGAHDRFLRQCPAPTVRLTRDPSRQGAGAADWYRQVAPRLDASHCRGFLPDCGLLPVLRLIDRVAWSSAPDPVPVLDVPGERSVCSDRLNIAVHLHATAIEDEQPWC
jgi:hypothetical protein